MSRIDWTIIIGTLAITTWAALYTRRFTRSVSDFLAANRSAGRYVLCVGDGMAALGAISIIAMWEMYYQAGFTAMWWRMIVWIILPSIFGLSGWIFYRYRQTRALTIAQFFELRYSRKLRVFTGILIWLSGIVNFGIFPAVGARFFIYFLNIENSTANYITIMLALIGLALFFTFAGGQIAVIVTDFLQGTFCNIAFIIILACLFWKFSWQQIYESLSNIPAGNSMVNPFKISNAADFGPAFYIIQTMAYFYSYGSWQGNQAYNASARNPHEARMGKSLQIWRQLLMIVFTLMLPIFAYTAMHSPEYSQTAARVQNQLGEVETVVGPTIQKQVEVTVILRNILPTGISGLLAAIMLVAFISTNDTYLHSWGAIFIQDVILPFRKKSLSPQTHMRLLRLSITAVAVFVFLFSLLFRQVDYIFMFFQITAAIIAGCGALIIGGLYWKKGSTEGAWAAMISGAVISLLFIVLQQVHAHSPLKNDLLRYFASCGGMTASAYAYGIAIALYITISLIVNRDANMDKILNRGKYQIEDEKCIQPQTPLKLFLAGIGIDKNICRTDRIICFSVFLWIVLITLIFIAFNILNIFVDLTDIFWFKFWKIFVIFLFIMGSAVAVWLTWGGFADLRKMFARLSVLKRDQGDDGMVHQNQERP